MFKLFTKQYDTASIHKSSEGDFIQLLGASQPPKRRSNPKRVQLAMMMTWALAFALLLFVFIRQALRNAGQAPEVAEKLNRLPQGMTRDFGGS